MAQQVINDYESGLGNWFKRLPDGGWLTFKAVHPTIVQQGCRQPVEVAARFYTMAQNGNLWGVDLEHFRLLCDKCLLQKVQPQLEPPDPNDPVYAATGTWSEAEVLKRAAALGEREKQIAARIAAKKGGGRDPALVAVPKPNEVKQAGPKETTYGQGGPLKSTADIRELVEDAIEKLKRKQTPDCTVRATFMEDWSQWIGDSSGAAGKLEQKRMALKAKLMELNNQAGVGDEKLRVERQLAKISMQLQSIQLFPEKDRNAGFWAVSFEQLMELKDYVVKTWTPDSKMNVILLNDEYLKAKCKEFQSSLACSKWTKSGGKPRRARVFVSHCWLEPFLELVQSIEEEFAAMPVADKPDMFICFMSLMQGDPATIAKQVGTNNANGLDSVNFDENPPPFVVALAWADQFLIVRNRVCDIYTRGWCALEGLYALKFGFFDDKADGRVKVIGPAEGLGHHNFDALKAKCSYPKDMEDIRACLKESTVDLGKLQHEIEWIHSQGTPLSQADRKLREVQPDPPSPPSAMPATEAETQKLIEDLTAQKVEAAATDHFTTATIMKERIVELNAHLAHFSEVAKPDPPAAMPSTSAEELKARIADVTKQKQEAAKTEDFAEAGRLKKELEYLSARLPLQETLEATQAFKKAAADAENYEEASRLKQQEDKVIAQLGELRLS